MGGMRTPTTRQTSRCLSGNYEVTDRSSVSTAGVTENSRIASMPRNGSGPLGVGQKAESRP